MVKFSDTISTRKIEGEIFIFDRKTSVIHSLNKVGSFIWGQLIESNQVDEIAEEVYNRFEVDLQTAKRDIAEFVNELEGKKLLTIISKE